MKPATAVLEPSSSASASPRSARPNTARSSPRFRSPPRTGGGVSDPLPHRGLVALLPIVCDRGAFSVSAGVSPRLGRVAKAVGEPLQRGGEAEARVVVAGEFV